VLYQPLSCGAHSKSFICDPHAPGWLRNTSISWQLWGCSGRQSSKARSSISCCRKVRVLCRRSRSHGHGRAHAFRGGGQHSGVRGSNPHGALICLASSRCATRPHRPGLKQHRNRKITSAELPLRVAACWWPGVVGQHLTTGCFSHRRSCTAWAATSASRRLTSCPAPRCVASKAAVSVLDAHFLAPPSNACQVTLARVRSATTHRPRPHLCSRVSVDRGRVLPHGRRGRSRSSGRRRPSSW